MFLKRLYNEWRSLFWALLLFMAAQLFFMAKGIENIPFFLYHMYGQVHPRKDSTAVYLVKTKEGYFNHKKLSSREQEMLLNPVIYYANLKKDGDGTVETVENRFGSVAGAQTMAYLQKQLGNDSLSLTRFPGWWGNYFRLVSKDAFDSVSVVRSYVYSKAPYHKAAADSLSFTVKLR
ncbi:MAG TPA: hypothetical protein PK133_03365 [Ferruginibacter sp.]|nr:hypothetical protein [Ferruginibacter sp.]